MIQKFKALTRNQKIKLFAVNALILCMGVATVFCSTSTDPFATANGKITNFAVSLENLALTCCAFFAILSAIWYAATSNERSAEKAKAWFIRCVVALGMVFLAKTMTTGILHDTIESLFQ